MVSVIEVFQFVRVLPFRAYIVAVDTNGPHPAVQLYNCGRVRRLRSLSKLLHLQKREVNCVDVLSLAVGRAVCGVAVEQETWAKSSLQVRVYNLTIQLHRFLVNADHFSIMLHIL